MKNIVFERELRLMLNYIREYGIQHCKEKSIEVLSRDPEKMDDFMKNVHKGFLLAQKNAIYLLRKVLKEQKSIKLALKQARRERNKDKEKEIKNKLGKVQYQEILIRRMMDSIAWQIFHYDLSVMRRLYYGQELIDITDSNIESEIEYVDRFIESNPGGFVLISDLTSFIQIGDVISIAPGQGMRIGELKDGEMNYKVFEIIKDALEVKCPYYIQNQIKDESLKFKEQVFRDIKQITRNLEVSQVLNSGEGKDLFTGLPTKIDDEEIELDTFADIVENLLDQSHHKGHAISVIEDCLLVGVFDETKVSSKAFDNWAESLEIKMPIVDLRQGVTDPMSFPIFILPFKGSDIIDIVKGKIVIKMTLDIEKWLDTFKERDIKWRWISKKETARINSNLKGKNKIFSLDGCGIEINDKNGASQLIGDGIFSRMFTSFNTPLSMRKYLCTVIEKSNTIQTK